MSLSNWKESCLSKVSNITMGQSPKSEFCNNIGEGVPLLNGPTEFGSNHPSPTQFTVDVKKWARKGELLFCVRGSTVGRMNWADQDYAIGRGIAAISPINKNNDRFIKALMELNLPLMLNMATGSTFPNITKNMLTDLSIMLPSSEERVKINNILKSIEDKIETNSIINKKLKEMAQEIFKQWFVDFEFPNEEGKPYKSSGGTMDESEYGRIPEGWRILFLNDIVEIKYGKNLPTKNLVESGYPVFGGNGEIGFYDEYIYEKPQVLIACRGAASGKVLTSLPFSFITNNSLVLENDESKVSYEYLSQYCLLNQFQSFATGSAQPQITIANLNTAKIVVPNKKIIRQFSKIIRPINSKILLNTQEIIKLNSIRDTLLPKLMSGEIRVPVEKE